jgi:hypothetical protein
MCRTFEHNGEVLSKNSLVVHELMKKQSYMKEGDITGMYPISNGTQQGLCDSVGIVGGYRGN